MAVNKRATGADKEQLAARYLVDNGYLFLNGISAIKQVR